MQPWSGPNSRRHSMWPESKVKPGGSILQEMRACECQLYHATTPQQRSWLCHSLFHFTFCSKDAGLLFSLLIRDTAFLTADETTPCLFSSVSLWDKFSHQMVCECGMIRLMIGVVTWWTRVYRLFSCGDQSVIMGGLVLNFGEEQLHLSCISDKSGVPILMMVNHTLNLAIWYSFLYHLVPRGRREQQQYQRELGHWLYGWNEQRD